MADTFPAQLPAPCESELAQWHTGLPHFHDPIILPTLDARTDPTSRFFSRSWFVDRYLHLRPARGNMAILVASEQSEHQQQKIAYPTFGTVLCRATCPSAVCAVSTCPVDNGNESMWLVRPTPPPTLSYWTMPSRLWTTTPRTTCSGSACVAVWLTRPSSSSPIKWRCAAFPPMFWSM
jgi:hypothetical protein